VIPWEQISSDQYEKLVSILLSQINSRTRRIDGSGGDGGRDVQFQATDGLHVFQLKGFTGRLDERRRRQVVRSLEKAATLGPVDWTLVVPIDPTPRELTWFEGLRDSVPFGIEYLGRTWLDAQMASRPAIGRYVREDAANEIARLAQVLNQERAVLAGGAPDALQRAGSVVDQLNAMDPFYRYEITLGESRRQVRISPRYAGAEDDRPITGEFRLRFPNDEAGRAAADAFRRTIDYGTPVVVSKDYVERASLDAPMQLGGSWDRVELAIGPAVSEEVVRTLILACRTPEGSRAADIALDFRRESVGQRGSTWKGADPTGTLTVALTVDVADRRLQVNVNVTAVENFYPRQMVPVMRFLSAFVAPNVLAIEAGDGSRLSELTGGPGDAWVEPFMPPLVEALATIQDTARMMRRVRPGTTREDFQNVMTASDLLTGQRVTARWDRLVMEVNDATLPDSGSIFDDEIPLTFVPDEAYGVAFDGVSYELGRLRVEYSARLGGVARRHGDEVEMQQIPEAWREAQSVPAGTEVVMVPARTDEVSIRLLPRT
jgi:hypothetical protein